MKTNQTSCDLESLSRFLDEELAPLELARVREHLAECRACRQRLQEHQAISRLFKKGLERELLRAGLQDLEENVVAVIRHNQMSWGARIGHFLMSRKFYVPATAVAALVVFFLAFSGPGHVAAPSALISYLGGDIESVMILETQESHRTIVWFNEMLTSDDEAGGVQEDQSALPIYGQTYLAT